MESLLEQQRHYLEERERLEKAFCDEGLANHKTHKAKLNSEHKRRKYIERFMDLSKKIYDILDDNGGKFENEKDIMKSQNPFVEFYKDFKDLKDYYKVNTEEIGSSLTVEFQKAYEEIGNEADMIDFTDEEGYGKFLDLTSMLLLYLNLKDMKKIEYLEYVGNFDNFDKISEGTKKTTNYKHYLNELYDYLYNFTKKAKPLINLDARLGESDNKVINEINKKKNTSSICQNASALNLDEFNNIEELEGLGLNRLKEALLALNLKCGGTLKERAERLWATKGKTMDEITSNKKLIKANDNVNEKRELFIKQTERKIKLMAVILKECVELTKENIQRKQARGYVEEEEDIADDADVEEALEEAENDDGVPYNPKNLPLGWDGKPIPYWLYKLHGLNIPYSCEICGNQVYKGPKNFQKHFTEWRHSHGLRCLGIQNSAHFVNITKAEDAKVLWEKLQIQQDTSKWNADIEEEYEDNLGNVINKKTYEDLKRQRLL
uniref:Matrin-type domain-containing protein n=1 Tax=Parastrongyloides trichosuri TaxID=131310 RepID=A0A0N4ZU64_PARTI